jgi:hypothetical protein
MPNVDKLSITLTPGLADLVRRAIVSGKYVWAHVSSAPSGPL